MDEEDSSQDGQTWDMIRNRVPAVEAASFGGTSGVNLEAHSKAARSVRYVLDRRVPARYFDVLGIRLGLGRSFTEEEDRLTPELLEAARRFARSRTQGAR